MKCIQIVEILLFLKDQRSFYTSRFCPIAVPQDCANNPEAFFVSDRSSVSNILADISRRVKRVRRNFRFNFSFF